MKKQFFVPVFMLFVMSLAHTIDEDTENILGFLSGKYILIGKKINSKETYTGTVEFAYNEKTGQLDMTRKINGKTVKGTASLEDALGGEAKVLRIRFVENKTEIEGTFLWRSDLDNYGRLSGYIYTRTPETKDPGLEAYFIQQE